MSYEDHREKLDRSISIYNLPNDYQVEDVTAIFKNVGEITEVKSGLSELIVTFIDQSAKEMAKMYDGCQVADKYTLKLSDAKSFEIKTATQAQEEELNSIDQKSKGLSDFQQIPETLKEFLPASRVSAVKKEENDGSQKVGTAIIFKTGLAAIDNLYSTQAKDFLGQLNNTNLPVRAELKSDDPFTPFMKREFLLSFFAIWSILWFLGSLFF